MQAYGLFTLPEIDTDTDKMGTEPNGNLHRSPSLSSVNGPKQFYKGHTLWVSVSLSSSVNTPLRR